jgi:hypothetical protein
MFLFRPLLWFWMTIIQNHSLGLTYYVYDFITCTIFILILIILLYLLLILTKV